MLTVSSREEMNTIPQPSAKQSINQPSNTDPSATETGNLILLNLAKLERSLPALKPVVEQLQSLVIKAEALSPRDRILSVLGFLFMAGLMKKNHVLGTQMLVASGAIWSSLKALVNPQSDDYERWLFFWSVFGVSSLGDWFLRNKLYHYAKVIFFFWLSRDGSLYIYQRLLNRLAILKK